MSFAGLGGVDYSMEEFRAMMDRAPAEVDLVRVDISVVRRLVAGGIRFTRQNGFRLPPKYDRWTAILGELPDVASADLSDFGVNGKLRYVGPVEDLSRRLVSGRAEELLQRKDVEFVLGYEDDGLVDANEPFFDDSADDLAVAMGAMRGRMLSTVREYCFAHGMIPHPRLPEAVDLTLESALIADADPNEEPGEEEVDIAVGQLAESLSSESPADREELAFAFDQLRQFAEQYSTPMDMFKALGMEGLIEPE